MRVGVKGLVARGRAPLAAAALGVLAAAPGCMRTPPAEYRVLVSEAASGTVAAVDPSTSRIVARVTVGMLPHEMALSPDGRSLYVVLVGSQAVAEIDVPTLRLRRTFLTAPVPERRADGTVIAAHRERDAFSHTSCFDCHRNEPGAARPANVGDRPFGLALSSDGRRLFVSHVKGGSVADIDLASGRIARTVRLAPVGSAHEAGALARVGRDLYVMLRPTQPSREAAVVRRLDADTLEARGDVVVGSDPAAAKALGGGRVLVSNFESDTLSEIGPDGLRARYSVAPGPLGAVPLEGGRRVLALDYYANAISFVDLETGRVRTAKLARAGRVYANPTHGAQAPDGRVWVVTSGADGHLLSLDARSGEVLGDVPVAGLSFDVAIAPARAGTRPGTEVEVSPWVAVRQGR